MYFPIYTYRYVTGATRTCVALIPMLRGSNVRLAKATFTGTTLGNSDVDGAIYFVSRLVPQPNTTNFVHVSML